MSSKTKSEMPNSSPNRIGNRIRFSIVWKLNIKLFLRRLRFLFTLNLILVLMFAAGLIIHAEQVVATAAKILNQTEFTAPETEKLITLTGCSVSLQSEEENGFYVPKDLQALLAKETASGVRRFDLPQIQSLSSWELIKNIKYIVIIKANGNSYNISYHAEKSLQAVVGMFGFLLLLELLMLLISIPSGARMIRKTLRPIEELSITAHTLSTKGLFAPEQLRVLAGKLDNINATRLDTRISVDETQSELKSLASAINGMLDRINESYRSQIRFVSDASHELRTPISVIEGYVNLLDRWGKNDTKTLQESIEAIKDETANMKELVEQLLFLARGDNNTIPLQIECFELSTLANEVLRETQMIDGGHEYDACITSVFINADKSLIKQAMRILIDNAMKYTPAGKRITISISSANDYAYLTVQDEGIGIAPEAVSNILDRFYRTDESRARATGGSGLGLSIAKWITERHGGHIEILSRLDIGTRISIVLPIAPAPENDKTI